MPFYYWFLSPISVSPIILVAVELSRSSLNSILSPSSSRQLSSPLLVPHTSFPTMQRATSARAWSLHFWRSPLHRMEFPVSHPRWTTPLACDIISYHRHPSRCSANWLYFYPDKGFKVVRIALNIVITILLFARTPFSLLRLSHYEDTNPKLLFCLWIGQSMYSVVTVLGTGFDV